MTRRTWGKIAVGTRLGKGVPSEFIVGWLALILRGMRKGDSVLVERGKPAHWAANGLIHQFLKSDCDSLLFLDDDAAFETDFLNRLREHPEGQDYDALQAFHTRRGWPPEAIWFKWDDIGGNMLQCVVTQEGTEPVGLVGTHCALFRREVFEQIRLDAIARDPDIDPEKFEWFCYPRNQEMSDEATLSHEARKLGFKLGATTAVKVGHLSTIVSAWETYQEYLVMSGTLQRYQTLEYLAGMVAEFTGQTINEVLALAVMGADNVRQPWLEANPQTPAEERLFYSTCAGYLYDLCSWNASQGYLDILQPLGAYENKRCLVIGAGLGNEAEVLSRHNTVDVYELPGVLREFTGRRLSDKVALLSGDTLEQAPLPMHAYDLVVAIDTLEHIHPDEFHSVMEIIFNSLKPGGMLYAHSTWNQSEMYPMHHDNSLEFSQWLFTANMTKEGKGLWRKSE